jgi:predicted deacylase
LANHVYGYHLGRYDLDGDGNFNRWYPDFSKKIARGLGNALGDDEDDNRRAIHAAARAAIEAWPAEGEANTLRKALMALSVDADIVLDLHCHGEAIQYLYFPEDYWPSHADLPAELGCKTILLYPTDEGATFDVAPTLYWHRLAERFPDRPIPRPPFTTTIELRGQQDVSDVLAEQDAGALWRFLQRHGALAGDPGSAPALLCRPTPVDGVDHATAPHAGVLSYHVKIGDAVKKDDVIADVVDPAEVDFQKARTAVRTRTDGIVFGRNLSMLVRPGQSFASIAGPEPLPEPDLPFIDY